MPIHRYAMLGLFSGLISIPTQAHTGSLGLSPEHTWEKRASMPLSALKSESSAILPGLPVREVTMFKDGHAYVVQEGERSVVDGRIVLDDLPSAILGTFWPYARQDGLTLESVSSGRLRLNVERTALEIHEFILANPGAEVIITEGPSGGSAQPRPPFAGTLIGIPERTIEELELTNPTPGMGGDPEPLPQRSRYVKVRTQEGVRLIPMDRIEQITFKNDPVVKLTREEYRTQMTYRLQGAESGGTARVGHASLQRGLRWIPSYKLVLDGKGKARAQLRATLSNDLADLSDVKVNLVVGIPHFAFEGIIDPIARQQVLQENFRQVSGYMNNSSQLLNYAGNNRLMSQQIADDFSTQRDSSAPHLAGAADAEDLHMFTLDHITLRRGETMTVEVTSFDIEYQDIYKLDLPLAPPDEILLSGGQQCHREMVSLLNNPKVKHVLRIKNTSEHPLTTAPCMNMLEDKILSQGQMTYTAAGNTCDLELAETVRVRAAVKDIEVERIPNATQWQGETYGLIKNQGRVMLANDSKQNVTLEITRFVPGDATSAEHGLKESASSEGVSIEKLGVFSRKLPEWCERVSWPHWWNHFNPRSQVIWRITLDPGTETELRLNWQHHWR
ncbi:MAG: hypothetical protein AB7F75_11110 [Planctomycetota bacterium]